MKALDGWWRLWVVAAVSALAYAIWTGVPPIVDWEGKSHRVACLPGSLSTSQRNVRVDHQKEANLLDAAIVRSQINYDGLTPENLTKISNRNEDLRQKAYEIERRPTKPTTEVRHYGSCRPAWPMVQNVLIYLGFALVLLPAFVVGRWVLAGFKGAK